MNKKGTCNVCHEEFEVTQDNLIVYHRNKETNDVCLGMGHTPAAAAKTVTDNHNLTAYGFKPSVDKRKDGFEKW